MDIKKLISILIALQIICICVYSQSREELEKKRKQKEEEIRLTKKLLEETGEKQKKSIEYLNVLKNQIETRESLINTLRMETRYLSEEIAESQEILNSLQKDLNTLKKEYSSMVRFAFKTRNNYNKIGFILSASSFNQSYKRLKLLQNYSQYRKKQMHLIAQTGQAINGKINELNSKVVEKNVLLDVQNKEKSSLEQDKESENKVLGDLKKKEGQLKKELAAKEKIKAQINRQIEELIKKEIKPATTTKGSTTTFANTPEGKKLSFDFSENKGRLPWPVDKGIVSEKFGTHKHPTLDDVEVNNNGIKIVCPKNTEVRAIFNGIVKNIINIPGSGKTVLINHGEYYTVYMNLDEVYVKPGDKVSTKQKLGKIKYDDKSGKTETELQIWRLTTKQDPLIWIMR